MIKSCQKTKKIRLKGKAKKDLQRKVLERDNFFCLQCGRYTQAPFHHHPKISQGGEDILEHAHTLCVKCHDKYPNWKGKV